MVGTAVVCRSNYPNARGDEEKGGRRGGGGRGACAFRPCGESTEDGTLYVSRGVECGWYHEGGVCE